MKDQWIPKYYMMQLYLCFMSVYTQIIAAVKKTPAMPMYRRDSGISAADR